MSFDNTNDGKPDEHASDAKTPNMATFDLKDRVTTFNNILQMISNNKPSLRLVKTLGNASAKILPFRRPLGLIVCGFALSAYALI
jgi:hypothetical protein